METFYYKILNNPKLRLLQMFLVMFLHRGLRPGHVVVKDNARSVLFGFFKIRNRVDDFVNSRHRIFYLFSHYPWSCIFFHRKGSCLFPKNSLLSLGAYFEQFLHLK